MTFLIEMVRKSRRAIFLSIIVVLGFGIGTGQALAAEVLLTVRNTADPSIAEVQLTEADLMRMPQVTIRTRTEFTDGVVEFIGPMARDVVALAAGASDSIVRLVAVNDYAFEISLSDLKDFDVILAMQANGQRLTLRDKGPIWVMYPMDDHPELGDRSVSSRLVWQLTVMELR